MITNNQKFAHNSSEDIAKAAVSYSMCKSAYEYQYKHGGLPIPHKTTLENWLTKFQVRPGYLHDSIAIAEKMKDETDKPLYQHAMLVFDEVYLKKDAVELDQKTQTIYGPCSKLQVVQIRGLASK